QGALMSGTALIAVPKVDTAGLPRYATSGSVLLTPKGRVRGGDFASLLGGEAQQVRQIEQAGEFAAEGERDDVVAVYHNAGDFARSTPWPLSVKAVGMMPWSTPASRAFSRS